MKQTTLVAVAALLALAAFIFFRLNDRNDEPPEASGQPKLITLRGATQFGEDHAFTRTIRKFEELVKANYDGPVEFELYLNSELGLEKDYFGYMSEGISVDYGIVSPSHMSTFSNAAPLMDMPFLFRDVDHWNKVLDSDAFDSIGREVAEKADVMIIGHAGGGVRNLIVKRPVTNMDQLKGLSIRVMGAP
ncbi:MAG: TRAP transporter substrate-binding protein DctP, partial [Pirellulaceae bacterium]|nr:TRAP transporter substrate-binding protein DctP [Pirellulaceae bacterium]